MPREHQCHAAPTRFIDRPRLMRQQHDRALRVAPSQGALQVSTLPEVIHRGTQFRRWAHERLRESLVKGFTRDDERLKNPGSPGAERYFEELFAHIRDIRSSEKVFWRKVLDIYATSVDYDPSIEASQRRPGHPRPRGHGGVPRHGKV